MTNKHDALGRLGWVPRPGTLLRRVKPNPPPADHRHYTDGIWEYATVVEPLNEIRWLGEDWITVEFGASQRRKQWSWNKLRRLGWEIAPP